MAEFAAQPHGVENASGDLCHRSSVQVSSEHLDRMLNEHHSQKWLVTCSSNRHANAVERFMKKRCRFSGAVVAFEQTTS
ncbi:hypothetical protein [Bradyrhizobium vignae]|uniref:hypothetical protein n=1 Tax=Bradyrhizobium vignae TaxID=1549949 RepID=UPI0011AE6C8D|nr:hypothetical protein [Bradyrhizobium vignae]